MRKTGLVLLMLTYSLSYAESVGLNSFHLPKMNCKSEENDKTETTPQSPPLVVDDPATPGCNTWEINVVVSTDVARNEKLFELPLLDINYGIGDDLQLKYEVPNIREQTDKETKSAVGSSVAGVKYMFLENEEAGLQVAVYPQVEFNEKQSDSVKKGMAEVGNVTSLPILLSKKIGETAAGDVMLTGNVGYSSTNQHEASDMMSAGIGIGAAIRSKLSFMADLVSERAVSKNKDGIHEEMTRANFGVMTPIYKDMILFGSIGQSLHSSDDLKHSFFLAGIRL